MSQKIYRTKMPLLVQHINMCHLDYPNICLISALTLFQIILRRFVPVQFSLIMPTQLNLKSFIKYAKKIVPSLENLS